MPVKFRLGDRVYHRLLDKWGTFDGLAADTATVWVTFDGGTEAVKVSRHLISKTDTTT
jgi:hypothetical protein